MFLFLVVVCFSPGVAELRCELRRGEAVERPMAARRVEPDPPRLDDAPRLGQRQEPVLTEALVPELSVEALDVRVLDGFAGPDEMELHLMLLRPRVDRATLKLRAVVDHDRAGVPAIQSEG